MANTALGGLRLSVLWSVDKIDHHAPALRLGNQLGQRPNGRSRAPLTPDHPTQIVTGGRQLDVGNLAPFPLGDRHVISSIRQGPGDHLDDVTRATHVATWVSSPPVSAAASAAATGAAVTSVTDSDASPSAGGAGCRAISVRTVSD